MLSTMYSLKKKKDNYLRIDHFPILLWFISLYILLLPEAATGLRELQIW